MSDTLLECGTAEEFKRGVHLTLFGLAMACFAYNSMAWCQRRSAHLARNVVIYGAFAAYEAVQTIHHHDARLMK